MTGLPHRLVAAATAMMLTAGALAGRVSGKTSAAVIAGLAAGAILALLGMATFAWLDNAFFSVISQQQEKIDSFWESGMNSMHAYLNSSLRSTTPGVTVLLAAAGALFAPLGAALSATAAEAWPHLRRFPRR